MPAGQSQASPTLPRLFSPSLVPTMAHTSSATKWEVRSPLRKGRYPCGSPGGGDCAPQAWARSAGSWPQDSGLADHRALPQELACPILMVIKTARGSDTAKVTRPEGGRTGLNSAPTSRTASCRCAAGPPAPPVFSPQQSGGRPGGVGKRVTCLPSGAGQEQASCAAG